MDAEVIIIGGGVIGLWTAYHLADQGVKTILFEQFPYPHTMGSSHGQSRLTRSYFIDEAYSAMIPESQRRWRELEKATGRKLLLNMGLVSLYNMKDRKKEFDYDERKVEALEINHEVISGENMEKRFPGFVSDSHNKGILYKEAGLLRADNCLLALQECYQQYGGELHDGDPVLSLKVVNSSKVEVKTEKRTYTCRSVVLTCGPYINNLLSSVDLKLPIEAVRALVYYWRDKSGGKYSLSKNFPGTVIHVLGHTYLYSLPVYEYPGLMKICYHCEAVIDPNQRDRMSSEQEVEEKRKLEWLKKEIKHSFPDIDATSPAIKEVCMLTNSPDSKYIIDFHPKHKNIVIGSGFSGRGFKSAPEVGRILAAMSMEQPPPYSLKPFSLKRFREQSKL